MTPDEHDELLRDALTVDGALKELKRLLPIGTFATVTVHEHGELNRPETIVKTVDSAEMIYIEGGYWFRGGSLREAMTEFRKWYKGVIA